MLQRAILITRVLTYTASFLLSDLYRFAVLRAKHLRRRIFPPPKGGAEPEDGEEEEEEEEEIRNIVVVGASFAGYEAARVLARALPLLPEGPRYRLVVVEPHSHFHFTWVLPRFCVVPDHEHKAFIPYGGLLLEGAARWVAGRAVGVSPSAVRLGGEEEGGEEIPYAFLIVATGSGIPAGGDGEEENSLPSRVGVDGKKEGIGRLRAVQRKIEGARNLVVVGGGAAGVELAADAKDRFPEKKVVLVHSRDTVMHRFGPGLQTAAMDGLKNLGVEVITGERLVGHDKESEFVTLQSGRRVECDALINCTGQRPASHLLAGLSPSSISPSGRVLVKPTMQIADNALPNVYACGDVAETGAQSPNARSANRQGAIAADNVLAAVQGKAPGREFIPHFVDGVTKLTLGLERSVVYIRDRDAELLLSSKEKDIALMSRQAWGKFGVKAFEDKAFEDDIDGDAVEDKDFGD